MTMLYPKEIDRAKEKERIKKSLRSLVILLAKVQGRTPTEVLREIQYNLDERKKARLN